MSEAVCCSGCNQNEPYAKHPPDFKDIQCYNCYEMGHIKRNCPVTFDGKCFKCRRYGHYKNECKEIFKKRRLSECYRCHGTDHKAKNCALFDMGKCAKDKMDIKKNQENQQNVKETLTSEDDCKATKTILVSKLEYCIIGYISPSLNPISIPSGFIRSVKVYKEKVAAPLKFMQRLTVNQKRDNKSGLKNRKSMYYIVIDCDSKQTAVNLYEKLKRMSNQKAVFDLKFIPEDTTYADEPIDLSHEFNSNCMSTFFKQEKKETHLMEDEGDLAQSFESNPISIKCREHKSMKEKENKMPSTSKLHPEPGSQGRDSGGSSSGHGYGRGGGGGYSNGNSRRFYGSSFGSGRDFDPDSMSSRMRPYTSPYDRPSMGPSLRDDSPSDRIDQRLVLLPKNSNLDKNNKKMKSKKQKKHSAY